MHRHLNLIKTDFEEVEKRVFPRFPFSFMTFKLNCLKNQHVYEVKDISLSGMQLALKSGEQILQKNDVVKGILKWGKDELEIEAKVFWIHDQRLGVAFNCEKKSFNQKIESFLSIENIVLHMRPIHEAQLGLDIPANLKYWLRSDAPLELFVWQHNDQEISRFQIILMQRFLEWEDGKGLKTGKVLKHRDADTPLHHIDEFHFHIEEQLDDEIVEISLKVLNSLPVGLIKLEDFNFLVLKLGRTH